MIKIVFFDKMRETYIDIDKVILIESTYSKINGRYTAVWDILKNDGKREVFKQKWYTIHRIERSPKQ